LNETKLSEIQFTKLQALGNDFLIIPVADVSQLDLPDRLAQAMCERNYGAGADGIIFVAPLQRGPADFASRIFNSDGSEAEISGNGTRCVAAYFYYKGIWDDSEIAIRTEAGIKVGRIISRQGLGFSFEFDMGTPRLSSDEIPIILPQNLDRVVSYPLFMGGEFQTITCVSMGNPHCSVFLPTLSDVNLAEIGPLLEDHPAFPTRTNVEFVHVISREEIEVLFWERGVGRTLSSGTGTCGASVASMLNNYTDRNICVNTPGGILHVRWDDDNQVKLTGTAEVIYEGVWLRK
jgi:diaminopimelate epimerase